MSTPAPGTDVLVACTKSGLVLVLDAILVSKEDREMIVHRLDVDGIKARFNGRPCPFCGGPCEYRPLVGPLFIPRASPLFPSP